MSTSQSLYEDAGSPTSAKKRSTRVACCHCRKRKHACDGARPTCTPCVRRNLECIYDTQDNSETRLSALRRQLETLREQKQSSKEQLDEVSETFHLLKAIPEDKALQLLKKVRASRDPVSAMSALRRSMLQSRTFGGESARSPVSALQAQSNGLLSPLPDHSGTSPEEDAFAPRPIRLRGSTSVLGHEQAPRESLPYYPTHSVHPSPNHVDPLTGHMNGYARPSYAVRTESSSTGYEYL